MGTWRNFVPCSRDFLRMVRLPEREFWCSFSFAAMWPFWLYDAEHRNSLLSLRSGLYISLNQICSWVQENGGWSRVLHSGLNVMQQTAVIGTCVAVFVCCMIYIRKNW